MVAASLPLSLTALIGRDDEVAALRRLIETTRLLTLTGAGGSGKTRLATEVAAGAASSFPGGVFWIELAPLADAALLPTYLLDVLEVEHGSRAPMTAILESLRERDALLVLDNCEHLVEACAALAEVLLRGCPRLRILATSREALGVAGERAWLVPGLVLPAAEARTVENVAESPAVRLFVDRAQAASATFQLTPSNASAVAQICRRLDGLPLAIELAAARVRALPPEELATRLDDAFRVLGSGARTAVPRHRTLREAVDWSYNLLDEREKTLLQRLSMFVGDFTLHAAESVGADIDIDAADILDTLGVLVDKSLVVMRETEGTARFQLLETIRQYASAKLREAGGFHRVSERHARTYMDLVAEAAPHLITRDRPQWVRRIHRELDNIRVALACTREGDVGAHLRLCGDLGWFWYSSGLWGEGKRWQESAIALPWTDDMRAARAAALLGGGVLASLQGEPGVADLWLAESAAQFQAVGDRSGESYALAYQGVSFGQRRDPRTVEPTTRALAWFREAGDLYGLRLCLVVLSTYYATIGEVERGREAGEEAVQVARAFGLDRELAIALQVFAGVSMALGDLPGAAKLVRESVAALRRDPSLFWSARALQQLAVVSFREGVAERGARLMGGAEVMREHIGASMFGPDRALLEPALALGRAALGDAEFDAAWKAGRSVPLDRLLEEEARESDSPGGAATDREPAADVPRGAPLDVRALGRLEILRDGIPLPAAAWRYARPQELLLYLLAHPGGRTRDQIGLAFWPDASPTQLKNNFHVMLHHVRKAIGRAELIAFDGERYRIAWELGVRFDARAFEEAVGPALRALRSSRGPEDLSWASDRIRETLPLYRGDFLSEEEAGDWHIEIRDRLRRLYAAAALALGDRDMLRGAYREAADSFGRAVAVDELHEDAYRRLMLALARAGDRTEALRHYDRLARALRADLAAEPEGETRALYERLRKAETV